MRRKLTIAATILALIAVSLTTTLPSAKAQDKTHHVGFVPPGFTSPFHVAMADGAKDEAGKLGWQIDVKAPEAEGDFAGQVTIIKDMLDKGVEAISTGPIQVEAMVAGVKAANEKGVPILMHNFITPLSEGKVTSYIGYDQWGGAEKLAIYTCGLLAKKYDTSVEEATGKVFILTGIESIYSHRRTQGFEEGLKTCPKVKIVGEVTAEWLRTKGEEVATAALQKTPDIDVFYGNSDEMAIGATLAAEKLGLVINEDYFAVGIDGNQPTLDLIKEGKFTATLGVDPFRMGVTVVDTLQKVLDGEEVPQFILTPSTVVDADNLADYIAGKTWTEPIAGAPEEDNGKPTIEKSEATAEGTMEAMPEGTMESEGMEPTMEATAE